MSVQSSGRESVQIDSAVKWLVEQVSDAEAARSQGRSTNRSVRSNISHASLSSSVSSPHSLRSQKRAERKHDKELTFAVLKKVQEFMHKKEYRLIDLFRDAHINTKVQHDDKTAFDDGDARAGWLFNGEHEHGRMSLDKSSCGTSLRI